MYISGPGVILVELIALFIHLFTPVNTKSWLVGGAAVFFVVFIPLYSIEYFRQEFSKTEKKRTLIKKRNTRTEWEGGNIHGKVPTETERLGKMFNK